MAKATDQTIPPDLAAYWTETGASAPDPDPAVRRVRSRPTARRAQADAQNRSTRSRIIAALMRSPRLLALYPAAPSRRVAALAALDELTSTPVWYDYWDVAYRDSTRWWKWAVTVAPDPAPPPYDYPDPSHPPYTAVYGAPTETDLPRENFAFWSAAVYTEDPPATITRVYRLPPRPAGTPPRPIAIAGTVTTFADAWRRGARVFDAWAHSLTVTSPTDAAAAPTSPFVPPDALADPSAYHGWTGHWRTTPMRGANSWDDYVDHEPDAHFYDLNETDPLLLFTDSPDAPSPSDDATRAVLHVGPLPARGYRLNNNDWAVWASDVDARVLTPREEPADGPWLVNAQYAPQHETIHIPTGWLSPGVPDHGAVTTYPASTWYIAIAADGTARTIDRAARTIATIYPTPAERAALPNARKSPAGIIVQTTDEVALRSSRWLTLEGGYGTPLSDALLAAADWLAGPTWDRHARLIGTTWYWYDGLTQLSAIPAPPGLAPRYQSTPTTLWCETTYAGAQHLFSTPWDGTTWTDTGTRTDTVWPIPASPDGALWHRRETDYNTYVWTRRAPDGTLTDTYPARFPLPVTDTPTTW